MAVAARVFATLLIFVFICTELMDITPVDRLKVVCKYKVCNVQNRRKFLEGKAWLKANVSKSARKRSHRRVAYSGELDGMDPFFKLLLCGDVELNPGPTNQQRNNKCVKNNEASDFPEILLRLEKTIESGQESILENQSRMLARLTTIEDQIEKFKVDISVLKTKQSELDSKVNAMSKEISLNCDHGKDLQFVIDRHEQYSRKNSIRLRGVVEEMGEDIEKVTLETLKKELDLDLVRSEIDIVHRVGRRDSNPRSILVKFLSHKTKERVMRCKKKATHIKIHEDLAPVRIGDFLMSTAYGPLMVKVSLDILITPAPSRSGPMPIIMT